jgi:putative solute:sodium symporter small subunit
MNTRMKQYWKKNLSIVGALLVLWFVVSFVFGIFAVEALNSIRFGGFKLGFWFAQQGSIFIFILIIFYYVHRMNKLDAEFDVNE